MNARKIQVVHDTAVDRPEEIVTYAHCRLCLVDLRSSKADDQSPRFYARLSFGYHADGAMQLWCVRHDVNVDVITPRLAPKGPPSPRAPRAVHGRHHLGGTLCAVVSSDAGRNYRTHVTEHRGNVTCRRCLQVLERLDRKKTGVAP